MDRIENALLSVLILVLGIPALFFGIAALAVAPSLFWAILTAVVTGASVVMVVLTLIEIWKD